MTDLELLDLVHDAVVVRERDGRIIRWNQEAARRYGYTAEEAIGKTIQDLILRNFYGINVEEAIQGEGRWEGKVRAKARDGSILVSQCRLKLGPEATQVIEIHGPVASRTDADLRLVIDHMPGLVSYIDSDLRYRFANKVYTQWFGTTEQEVVGACVEDVLGKEAFARIRPYMESALRGEFVHLDTYLPYSRAAGKHVSVSYVPDRDPYTNEVRGFVVLVEDNTARHNAEQALRDSESHYRQIVETAHEGIWIIGPDAQTKFANQRMADLLGTTIERLLQGHSFDYVFPEDTEKASQLFASKMQGDRGPFEFRLRRADGVPMWARISGVPMTDDRGEVKGLLGMFTNITAARESEQALRDSEERFRTLLANMPDIVSRFHRDGRFLYISPAVENATGQPAADFIGKTHSEAGIPEPLATYLSDKLADIVRSGTPTTVSFDMPAAGGSVRKYHGLGVPEFAQDGTVQTVLTIVHDVTDQSRVDEALRRSNAELEQFAYAAAHDLQEPLRVVGTYTQLFLRRYVGNDDPGVQQVGNFILKGVAQLQALVRDLLAYSRAVHEEPPALTAVALDEALDQSMTALDGVQIDAESRIEREPLPVVIGERGQLAQVFQNLLSNALKYRRSDQAPVIRIWAERSASEWVVSVQDNGIGFNPEYAERIFGLFKRLHREAYPGTGVGLGICRRIVERHGGTIWAESAGEGRGATFRFTVRAVE